MRLLTSLAMFALAPVALAQSFYETQLRAGQAALAAGRPQDAVGDLRIAAFGLLDKPSLLCEALESLTVAQEKAGQKASADATLTRLVEINRRFPGCRDARLEPGPRSEFESLARKRLSAAAADELLAPPAKPAASTAAPPPTVAAPPAAGPSAAPTPMRSGSVTAPATAAVAPSATPMPAPPSSPSPTPVRQESAGATPSEDLDRQPQLKVMTRPVYPVGAQSAGVGGIVLLRVLVSEKGEPARVEVARGVQPDLDQAAVAAVRQWLFEPGQKGGKAVASWMTVAVPFDAGRK